MVLVILVDGTDPFIPAVLAVTMVAPAANVNIGVNPAAPPAIVTVYAAGKIIVPFTVNFPTYPDDAF